jgi:3-deoxy-7-phosphoheptulonate synthase
MGRMAGQYGKPRSSEFEKKLINGKKVPSFKGDSIHGYNIDERENDPTRLVSAHFHSATTLNYIRSLLSGGFADLHHSKHWVKFWIVIMLLYCHCCVFLTIAML